MTNRYKAPRMIESKFQCVCAETGKIIRKGDKCLYFPDSKKVYHPDSDEAYQWRNNKMDEEVLSEPETEYNGKLLISWDEAKQKVHNAGGVKTPSNWLWCDKDDCGMYYPVKKIESATEVTKQATEKKPKATKPQAKKPTPAPATPSKATEPQAKSEPKGDKATEQFKAVIKRFLVNKAMTDELFESYYQKENKNLDDCITFILNSVKESGECGFTDDEIYSMAMHYYQEDNVKVGKPISGVRIVSNHKVELTEEEKAEARRKAMDDLAHEIKVKAKTPSKPKPTTTPAPVKNTQAEPEQKTQTELTLF